MKRADNEYYTFCLRAERARLDWQSTITKGTRCFQTLEDERLHQLHNLVQRYQTAMAEMAPQVAQVSIYRKKYIHPLDI